MHPPTNTAHDTDSVQPWNRWTLHGPVSWRDLVVADELRWAARTADAAADAAADQARGIGTAEAMDASLQAAAAADASADDFALFVADRTVEAGDDLDVWPAPIADEAVARFRRTHDDDLRDV